MRVVVGLFFLLVLLPSTTWGRMAVFQQLDTAEPLRLSFVARKEPGELQSLRAEVAGVVSQMALHRNQTLVRGDEAIRLTNATLQHDAAQARIELDRLAKEQKRVEQLRTQRAISDERYDEITARYTAARKRMDYLEGQLTKTTVTAGVDFFVTRVLVAVGDHVPAYSALAEGYALHDFQLAIALPSSYQNLFSQMDFYRRETDDTLHPLSESRLAVMRAPSGALQLIFPGEFPELALNQSVQIEAHLHSGLVALPFQAVFPDGKGQYAVYTLSPEGKIERVLLVEPQVFSDRMSFRNTARISNYLVGVTGMNSHSEVEAILAESADSLETVVRQ